MERSPERLKVLLRVSIGQVATSIKKLISAEREINSCPLAYP